MDEIKECFRCGGRLILESEFDDEGMKHLNYVCENCGAIHFATTLPPDEREDYPYYKEGEECGIGTTGYNGDCLFCGHNVGWDCDYNRSDILCDVEDEEDDSLATVCTCPNCGAYHEIIDAKPSEYKNYPYYTNLDDN